MKNILLVLPKPPVKPWKGDTLKFYRMLEVAKQIGRVDILTYINGKMCFYSNVEGIGSIQHKITVSTMKRILKALALRLTGVPLEAGYYATNSTDRYRISEVVDKYDIVYSALFRTYLPCRFIKDRNPKIIIYNDMADLISHHYQNYNGSIFDIYWIYKRIEWRAIKKIENKTFDLSEKVFLVNYGEFCSVNRENAILAPNGFDEFQTHWKGASVKRQRYNTCFIGGMSYRPNIDAFFYALSILESIPRVEFIIKVIGPGSDFIKVGNRANIIIEKMGYVEDVEEVLHTCDFMLAPVVNGAGIQNKILTGLSFGMPVFSSEKGMAPILDFARHFSQSSPGIEPTVGNLFLIDDLHKYVFYPEDFPISLDMKDFRKIFSWDRFNQQVRKEMTK